jgi:hypothetical protein
MSNTNTGGPAFPFPAYTYPNGEINHGEGGASLRDYFAAKAMQAYLPSVLERNAPNADLAAAAYKMADAMLRAREAK